MPLVSSRFVPASPMTRQDEIERFLERCAIDQPFLPLQLAEAVSGPAFNVAAAESELLRLLAQNRAYFRGGRWYPGAIPQVWRDRGYRLT